MISNSTSFHFTLHLNSILILSLCAAMLLSCGSTEEKTTLDSTEVELHHIVQKAKEKSLYSKNVDWKTVNEEFIELTKGTKNVEEMGAGLEFLINSMNDKHATFRKSDDFSIVASFTGGYDHEDLRDADFVNEVINDLDMHFTYELLDDQIGYLNVVAIHPALDVKEQADIIRQGILDMSSQGADKWILDLRCNGGGNMNPMVSGVAAFFKNGNIGGSINAEGEPVQELIIEDGKLIDTGRLVCEMDSLPVEAKNQKVVVLLSRYTVSSGELLAIAFKGRENTLFIGENTGGYVTGNGFEQVSDELLMVISESVFIDRNGEVYDRHVPVDVASEFDISLESDDQIEEARKWLLN